MQKSGFLITQLIYIVASLAGPSTDISPDIESSPRSLGPQGQGHRVQGRRTVSESSTQQFMLQEPPENSHVEESWENLQEVDRILA